MEEIKKAKVCFKCGNLKDLEDFYKHSKMSDGHLGKCKDCTRLDTKKYTEILTSTPEGLEKERERNREKYHRLNYKERSKVLNKNKPWKNSSKYKNINRRFKTPKGFELHHWNYNNDFLEDVVILKTKQHRQSHTYLELDMSLLIFKTKEGVLLDTKEKHIEFLLQKGIQF